jgi:GNAT superfamily N-acetyltransferase
MYQQLICATDPAARSQTAIIVVHEVAVAEPYQGKGIGKDLIKSVIEHGRKKLGQNIALSSTSGDDSLLRILLLCGLGQKLICL